MNESIALFLTLLPHSHSPHVPLAAASTSTVSTNNTLVVDCWARLRIRTSLPQGKGRGFTLRKCPTLSSVSSTY